MRAQRSLRAIDADLKRAVKIKLDAERDSPTWHAALDKINRLLDERRALIERESP